VFICGPFQRRSFLELKSLILSDSFYGGSPLLENASGRNAICIFMVHNHFLQTFSQGTGLMKQLTVEKIIEEIVTILMESALYWDLPVKERHQLIRRLVYYWN
jgi:hypothetical protein